MFAFVWLPRDELNTERRLAIAGLLEEATGRAGDQLVGRAGRGRSRPDPLHARHRAHEDPTPDVRELNRRLDAMVRGWEPSVEEALIGRVGAGRATRLTLTYAGDFPDFYRNRTESRGAARRISFASPGSTMKRSAMPASTAKRSTARNGCG